MITDEMFFRTAGKVAALESVVKGLVAMVFAMTAKDPAGFAAAAQHATEMGQQMKATIPPLINQLSAAHRNAGVAQIMLQEMEETIGRCFDQPAGTLSQVAEAILRSLPAASEAKN